MIDKKIKFGVIGCGYIGKKHIDIIQNHEEAELLAICDVFENTSFNPIQYYTDIDIFLSKEPSVEVVCITSPNGLHEVHALKCLNAGKHVVIEKPMALTKNACENILYDSLKTSKKVFCVMQNRYSPISQWLKKIITEKILGNIYIVQVNCFWNRDERYYNGNWHGKKDLDGGVLFTQFSHFVDMLYWLLGDILNIKSKFYNFKHQQNTELDEDSGLIHFEFLQGGLGSIQFTTAVWDKNLESSITIIAEKGTIKVGGQYMEKLIECHIQNYDYPDIKPPTQNNHYLLIDNVINVLKEKSSIATNALEGLKVVEIIEKMYQNKI